MCKRETGRHEFQENTRTVELESFDCCRVPTKVRTAVNFAVHDGLLFLPLLSLLFLLQV